MGINKKTIIDRLQRDLGYSQGRSAELFESLLEIIKSRLVSGDEVLVSGFGKFSVRDKTPRKGRNPATGEDLMLDARKVVTFKCSGKLKDRMNGDL
jgi:integration host factor subunit alpha